MLLWGARRVLGGLGFGVVWGCFPAGSSPGSAPGSWLGQQLPLPKSSSLPGNRKNRVNKAGLAPGGGTPRQAGTPHGVLALQNGAHWGWGAETPGTAGSRGAGVQGAGVQGPPRRVQECRIGGSRSAQIRGGAGFRDECTPRGCRDPKMDAESWGAGTPRRFRGAGPQERCKGKSFGSVRTPRGFRGPELG